MALNIHVELKRLGTLKTPQLIDLCAAKEMFLNVPIQGG
jgi:hypothetical protein